MALPFVPITDAFEIITRAVLGTHLAGFAALGRSLFLVTDAQIWLLAKGWVLVFAFLVFFYGKRNYKKKKCLPLNDII